MDVHFSKGFAAIMANRQGLQYAAASPHELPARRSMIDITDDFRWRLSDRLIAWAEQNCVGKLSLRFDPQAQWLVVGAEDATDLTMIATAF